MLTGAQPIAFVSTTDPAAARAFYERTLGLPFIEDAGFALVFDLGGTMLRVTRAESLTPQPFTVLGWRVDDAAATARALAARGVAFERYDGMEQDADGLWTSPGGGRIAWFRDPDGNLLSITSFPK